MTEHDQRDVHGFGADTGFDHEGRRGLLRCR